MKNTPKVVDKSLGNISALDYFRKNLERKDEIEKEKQKIDELTKGKSKYKLELDINTILHIVTSQVLKEKGLIGERTGDKARIIVHDNYVRIIRFKCQRDTNITFVDFDPEWDSPTAYSIAKIISPEFVNMINEICECTKGVVWKSQILKEIECEKIITVFWNSRYENKLEDVNLKKISLTVNEERDYSCSLFNISIDDSNNVLSSQETLLYSLFYHDEIFGKVLQLFEDAKKAVGEAQTQYNKLMDKYIEIMKKYNYYDYYIAYKLCEKTGGSND